MKKLNYLLAAVAVMAMAGCAKEKDVTPASETVKLHVTVDDTDTRVSIDNAYAFAFQSGDVISVLTDGGHPVEFVASEGGTSVDFSGTFEQGQAIGSYAMYPACEDHIADGDYMFFNIPEELTWRADESFMPMLGKINGGATTFKAVGGVLKLIVYNIPATAEYLQFDAQGQQISGIFEIEDASVATPVIETKSTEGSDDLITIDFSADYSENKVFYIPLPVGTISGFTVSFLDGAGDPIPGASKTTNATLGVTRNKIIIAPALKMRSISEDASLTNAEMAADLPTASYGNGTIESASGNWPFVQCRYISGELQMKKQSDGGYIKLPTFNDNIASIILNGVLNGGGTAYSGTVGLYSSTDTSNNPIASTTVSGINGTNITLTIPTGFKTGYLFSNGVIRITSITVKFRPPYVLPSITVDPSEVTMELTNGDYDTAEASITYENGLDNLGVSVIVDQQANPWLEYVDLVDNTLYISAPKNLTNSSRTGTITLRATGVTKSVTVTQPSSLVTPETTKLTAEDILAGTNIGTGYKNHTYTDSKNYSYSSYAISNYHSNATNDKGFIQIRAKQSTTYYYVELPTFTGKKITKIEMTVSDSSKPMDGGNNTATLYFSNSKQTSSTGSGVISGTGSSSVTLNTSSLDLSTGYITANGAVRIWDIEITFQ